MFAEAAERFFANRRGRPDEGAGECSCNGADNNPNGGSSGRSRSNGLGALAEDFFRRFGVFDLFHARSSSHTSGQGVSIASESAVSCAKP